MIPGAASRSPIVSNNGTAMMLADGAAPGRYSPASFNSTCTSSMSEMLCAIEIT